MTSIFCLIVKGDSYSTSFFYHAIQLGCIPIVISDWFVFSFPWIIPYHKFVLRVSENDFVKNPHYILDYIKSTIGLNDKLINAMRSNMIKYKALLSYDQITFNSIKHNEMLQYDQYYMKRNNNKVKSNQYNSTTTFLTILPLELLLLELKYLQYPHQYYNNIPCTRPTRCEDDLSFMQINQSNIQSIRKKLDNNITDYQFISLKQKQSHLPMYLSNFSSVSIQGNGRIHPIYIVKNEGYQVNPLSIPQVISNPFNNSSIIKFDDIRTHLCRHNTRLIGMYKMVYYMQCVRILWPLQPGKFKPVDNIAGRIVYSHSDNKYQEIVYGNDTIEAWVNNDNSNSYKGKPMRSKGKSSKSSKYRYDPDGISIEDMLFVTAYHDSNQSKHMILTNYPIVRHSLHHIYHLSSSTRIQNKFNKIHLV